MKMKTSIPIRNGVSSPMVDLVARLVDLIPWPIRRSAMGDVAISLLNLARMGLGLPFLLFRLLPKPSDAQIYA